MGKKRTRGNGEGTVFKKKRNGKDYYTVQITIGLDEKDKPIRKSFSSFKKSDALKKADDFKSKLSDGFDIIGAETTLYDFLHTWTFLVKQKKVKPRTFERYECNLRTKIKPFRIADVKLKDLNSLTIQKHLDDRIEDGTVTIKGAKDMFNLLKPALKYAVNKRLIPSFAIEGIELQKIRKKEDSFKFLETDEQELLIKDILSRKPNMKDGGVLFAIVTGARLGEIYAVETKDFLVDKKTIEINKQYQRNCYISKDGKKTYKYECIETKTENSDRILPLPNFCIPYFSELINQSPLFFNKKQLLFHDASGNPLERKILQRHIKKLSQKLKIQEIGMHGLRHTYATRLFENNTPIKTVQYLMGHSDIQTTLNIYIHISKKIKEQAEENINNIFKNIG